MRTSASSGNTLHLESGSKVFVQSGQDTAQLRAALENKKLTIVEARIDATVFVLENPLDPGMRILWRSVLVGAYLASPSVFTIGSGIAMKFHPALKTKRQIWISPGFTARHPVATEILTETIRNHKKKTWTVIPGGVENCHAAYAAARAQGRAAEVVGLIDNSEKADLG